MFAAIYIFLLKNIQYAVKNEKTPVLCQKPDPIGLSKKNQDPTGRLPCLNPD